MNNQQFENLKNTVTDFEDKHCFYIPSGDESISFDKETSQIRKRGHVISNVPRLAQQLKEGNQHVPASVRTLPNGKYEIKEGCTRALAAQEAEVDLWVTDYQHKVLNWAPSQWEDFQAKGSI